MSDVRRLTDDVYWIHGSHRIGDSGLDPYGSHEMDDGRKIHTALYLIDAGDEYALINSGDYDLRYEFEEEIDAITDGEGVDTIFVHESHVPNSANVESYRKKWDAEVIFPGGAAPIHGFPEVTMWSQVGENELAGRPVTLDQGPLHDLAHTTWIYDQPSGVFFTCDGFCMYHKQGETDLLSDELDRQLRYEDIHEYYADMLLWLKYADPERVIEDLEETVERYDISYIAPAHGNPIHADDIPAYVDHVSEAIRNIADSYEFEYERGAGA
jgi:flavorubredoxin